MTTQYAFAQEGTTTLAEPGTSPAGLTHRLRAKKQYIGVPYRRGESIPNILWESDQYNQIGEHALVLVGDAYQVVYPGHWLFWDQVDQNGIVAVLTQDEWTARGWRQISPTANPAPSALFEENRHYEAVRWQEGLYVPRSLYAKDGITSPDKTITTGAFMVISVGKENHKRGLVVFPGFWLLWEPGDYAAGKAPVCMLDQASVEALYHVDELPPQETEEAESDEEGEEEQSAAFPGQCAGGMSAGATGAAGRQNQARMLVDTLVSGHTINMASLMWVGPLSLTDQGDDEDDPTRRSAYYEFSLSGAEYPIRVDFIEQWPERRGGSKKYTYTEEDNQLWAEAVIKAKQGRQELVNLWTNWADQQQNGQ